jgi:endogenous inhibitor of DNA gyrase (YacG/DUF329 family)
MTRIQASCPTCGVVALPTAAVELRIDEAHPEDASYAFSCPRCRLTVRRPASRGVVRLLRAGGVAACAPAFTDADVDAFVARLADDDWFDELRRLTDLP